jgi:hypothetical protein
MEYTVPIVEVNYNQEDLPGFYMYISLNVLQHLIPYWSVSFTQKEITTGPLLSSLLAYCKNFLLYASMCFMSIHKQSTMISGFCWVGICVV